MKHFRHIIKVLTAAVVTCGLVGAPLHAASRTLPTTLPTPPPLNWQPCADAPTRDCATLTVPLDYANLSKGTINLPVARARATDTANTIGPLFFNLGGPAIPSTPTVKFGNLTSQFTAEIVSRFDIIGFNPRGTTDFIDCFVSETQNRQYWEANHLPKTTAEVTNVLALENQYNQACVNNPGNKPLVQHMDTASTVRDMEQLRRAMNIQKFSYIGFSYGTFIGTRYANLYPGHLRATVHDAVVDRSVPDIQAFTELNVGNELAWQKFKLWCHATPTCKLRGQNIDAVYEQQMTKARATPIPAPYNPFGNRPVDDWRLTFAIQVVVSLGNVTYTWVDEILFKAQQNDASLASLIYDSASGYNPDTNTYSSDGTRRTITCEDTAWSQTLRTTQDVQNLALKMKFASPRFGVANTYQGPAQCYKFPVTPVEIPPVPSKVGLADGSHTLLIGATGDVLTPITWAGRINQQIVGSRLLTRIGDGHISLGKSRCVEAAVNNALIRLTLPAPGATCLTDPDLYTPEPPPVLGPTATATQRSATPPPALPDYIKPLFR